MAVSERLLSILVCPASHQPVRPAGEDLLRRVNERIREGQVRSQGGEVLSEPLAEALVREDGALLYPVRDGIPVMLSDEAIPWET